MPSAKPPALPTLAPGALETLLDRTGALIYAVGPGGKILSINRALVDRLELDPAALPDLRAWTRALIAEPGLRDGIIATHERALAGEKVREAEWVHTTRGGDARQVRWQFVPQGEGAGRIVVVVGEDVTDRRKLEHWVRLQGGLLESVPEAVILADTEGRILHWSGGAERLLGYSPRSALERPLSNILAAETPRAMVLGWIDRARTEGSFRETLPLRRERGDSVECEVQVARVVGDRGQLQAIALIAAPPHAAVSAVPVANAEGEKGVRELDRAVGSIISVPAVVTAPDGTVRAWSRGAERLGGLSSVKARGQKVLDEVLIVPELGWDGLLTRLLARGKHSQTVEVRRPNGTRSRAELDAVALKAPDGTIDTVLMLFVDRAEADAVISESRRTKARALESVFAEGIVSRLLDAFAYFDPDHRVVLSRLADLRTIARMVANGASLREFDQVTRRAQLADKEKELDLVIDRLGDGLSRLRTLAHDVRSFAEADHGAPEPVRLSRELEAARDLLAHTFDNRHAVEFVVEDLPAARAVRGPLLRGLTLLLLASIESFGPEEEGRIHVEGKVQGGWIWLELRDNGQGYSSEVQTRITDLDFLASCGGYAPLFLGMAREAIREAGGTLDLGSAIGTGARVRVSFPIAEQAAGIRPMESPRPPMSSRGKILLVEEDALLRRALERHLGEVFEVVATPTVADAITEIGKQPFDVAVVSFPRPESFGLRLVTQLAETAPDLGRNMLVVVPPGVRHATRERLVLQGAIVLTRPADFTSIRSICERLVPGEMVVVEAEELGEV